MSRRLFAAPTCARVSVFLLGLACFAPRCPAAVQASLPKPKKSEAASPDATAIFVGSPFTNAYDNYIIVNVKAIGHNLRVQISTGPGYQRSDTLLNLINGSASGYHDTDSAQAALRWTSGDAALKPAWKSVSTNAHQQSPTRSHAADWTRDAPSRAADGRLVEAAHWDAAIPAEARHVEVVLVFTDVLPYTSREHDDRTATGRKRGDAPAIIGSWSGDFVSGKWTFRINPADITPPNRNSAGQKEFPTQKQIDNQIAQSQRIVRSRTGLALVRRDFGASASAASDRKWDTGFDIVPGK